MCLAYTSGELPAPFSRAVVGVYVAGKISYITFYCHEDGRNTPLRMIIKKITNQRGVIFEKVVLFINNAVNSWKGKHRKEVQYMKIAYSKNSVNFDLPTDEVVGVIV